MLKRFVWSHLLLALPSATFVRPLGLASGLWFCWNAGAEIWTYHPKITFWFSLTSPTYFRMMLSIVYGPPCKKGKCEFLEALHQTASLFCCPWLCLGDFNVVFLQVDKRRGRPLNTTSTNGSIVNHQGLIDQSFSSNPFTWSNKKDIILKTSKNV